MLIDQKYPSTYYHHDSWACKFRPNFDIVVVEDDPAEENNLAVEGIVAVVAVEDNLAVVVDHIEVDIVVAAHIVAEVDIVVAEVDIVVADHIVVVDHIAVVGHIAVVEVGIEFVALHCSIVLVGFVVG